MALSHEVDFNGEDYVRFGEIAEVLLIETSQSELLESYEKDVKPTLSVMLGEFLPDFIIESLHEEQESKSIDKKLSTRTIASKIVMNSLGCSLEGYSNLEGDYLNPTAFAILRTMHEGLMGSMYLLSDVEESRKIGPIDFAKRVAEMEEIQGEEPPSDERFARIESSMTILGDLLEKDHTGGYVVDRFVKDAKNNPDINDFYVAGAMIGAWAYKKTYKVIEPLVA